MVPSWHAINSAIWLFALLLQIALAMAVAMRRLPPKYPAFTAVIVFYPIRAALLFELSRHAAADTREVWSTALSWVAILLEAWLLIELAGHLFRDLPARRRALFAATIAAATLGCTWITLALVPGRIEVDRTQVFFWWGMLGMTIAAIAWSRSPNLLRICAGFAVFSLAQLAAVAGRTHAWRVRNSHAWVGWSYLPAAAYIAVAAWWLLFLRSEREVPVAAATTTGSVSG
jgi:hypothetical protein